MKGIGIAFVGESLIAATSKKPSSKGESGKRSLADEGEGLTRWGNLICSTGQAYHLFFKLPGMYS